jgi:hypothetical protein
MSLFRRRQAAAVDRSYSLVRDSSGEVVGFWLLSAKDARDSGLIEALLAKEDLLHLLGRQRTRQANTADDRGGVFVLFGDAASAAEGTGSRGTGRELTVDGTTYQLHDDFASFAADAAAGKVALLRTTFDVPLRTHMERLMPVLSEAYGIDAPQTRAITEGGFHCLDCFADHSRAMLLGGLLGSSGTVILTSGPGSADRLRKQLGAKSCTKCGSRDAVWIYDPSRRPS